jgi:hypothetical protein
MPLGADSFESIGIPPGVSRSEFESATPSGRLGKWQSAVGEYFPNTGSNTNDSDVVAGDNAVHAEAAVDAFKAQKNEELVRYRKEVERKAKLAENAGGEDKPRKSKVKSEEKKSRE